MYDVPSGYASISYYRRCIPMTTLSRQTEQWEHISLERRKQFRKDLTEHTCRAGLLFGHLSHGAWLRDVRELLTA
jgi:hypothetical protein